jgi:DNA-binding transcriptional regulator YiaG
MIAQFRRKLGMSQSEFAFALGLAGANVVSRWETGRRAPNEAVRRVIRYLNELPSPEAKGIVRKLKSYGAERELGDTKHD